MRLLDVTVFRIEFILLFSVYIKVGVSIKISWKFKNKKIAVEPIRWNYAPRENLISEIGQIYESKI